MHLLSTGHCARRQILRGEQHRPSPYQYGA